MKDENRRNPSPGEPALAFPWRVKPFYIQSQVRSNDCYSLGKVHYTPYGTIPGYP